MNDASRSQPLVALAAVVLATAAQAATAKTWADKCATRGYVCVQITKVAHGDGSNITVTVDNDPALITKTGGFPKAVVWKIPRGYVFNYRGGGISFKPEGAPPPEEIDMPTPINEDEASTGELTERFKVRVRKLLAADRKYTLVFHEMNGGVPTLRIVCDPTIANSGGPFTDMVAGRARPGAKVANDTVPTPSPTDLQCKAFPES